MKTLSLAILLLGVCRTLAFDAFYTATITFTNNPANNDSITINAKTWTFKSTVTDTATQVQIGATSGNTAANYFARIQSTPYTSLDSAIENTNKVRLNGKANLVITGSKVGTWGTVNVTSTTLKDFTVTYNFSNRVDRVEMANAILAGLTAYANTPVPATAGWLTNFFNIAGPQIITGSNTFTGANVLSNAEQMIVLGIITNAHLKNIPDATITNLAVLGPFSVFNNNPGVYWTDLDGGADEKVTELNFNGATYALKFWDDSIGSFVNAFTITRVGKVPQVINFPFGMVTAVKLVSSDIEGVFTNATGGFTNVYVTNLFVFGPSSFTGNANFAGKVVSPDIEGVITNATGGFTNVYVANLLQVIGSFLLQGNAALSGILGVGGTNVTGPAGLSAGLAITNALTEATADPANGVAVWSFGGEMKARGVGDGANWRFKNAAAISIGSGSDYNLTATYAQATFGSSVTLSLPTAGTYRVLGLVTVDEDAGNANDSISAKLYNSTDAADITGSERTISSLAAAKRGAIVLESIVTVTASKTIQLYAKNSTAARGSIDSEQTSLSYIRLY